MDEEMTVKDLINKLQQFDENKLVTIRNDEGLYGDIEHVCMNEDVPRSTRNFDGMVCISM